MYFINQITQDDCGFASLKILLANLKKEESYLYLKQDERHGAYSYQELCDLSETYGVSLVGFRVDNKDEIKHADMLPMIVTIRIEESVHAVCLYSINKRYVTLLDPSVGKVKMKFKKFFDFWDGTGLLITNKKEANEKIELPIKKEKNHLFDYLFQFLDGATFLFGLLTMSLDNFFIYSLIGLVGSVIFEIASRMIKVCEMKKFDRKMGEILENVEAKNFDKFLSRKEKYKESVFSNKNNFIYYLFISIFIVFTIIVGNPMNFACVLLPILFAIFESQIFSKKEKLTINELEKMENKFNKSKSELKVKALYENIHFKSYNFANFIFIKKCIGICLLGTCAALSLFICNTLNLINFLFLLFTEVYLYQNLCSLMSYENGVTERRICFMRLINIL